MGAHVNLNVKNGKGNWQHLPEKSTRAHGRIVAATLTFEVKGTMAIMSPRLYAWNHKQK